MYCRMMGKGYHDVSANQKFPYLQKKVAATGKLRMYTRKSLMKMLREGGAYPTYNVSRRTDYLIVGERPGIKLEKAITLGVCIDESSEKNIMHCGKYAASHQSWRAGDDPRTRWRI